MSNANHIGRLKEYKPGELLNFAFRMFLGEQCKYCSRVFKTLHDLEDAVYAGCHKGGRIACYKCWKRNA